MIACVANVFTKFIKKVGINHYKHVFSNSVNVEHRMTLKFSD